MGSRKESETTEQLNSSGCIEYSSGATQEALVDSFYMQQSASAYPNSQSMLPPPILLQAPSHLATSLLAMFESVSVL